MLWVKQATSLAGRDVLAVSLVDDWLTCGFVALETSEHGQPWAVGPVMFRDRVIDDEPTIKGLPTRRTSLKGE